MTITTTKGTRVVALVAGTGLVVASAGFGAVYAYTVGISHGIVLAGLTILFAVALELAKPLAISEALRALSSWRTWPRAVALGILGLVAVAYSLTAELSLTASSRGDLTAKREQASDTSQRALERHTRAKAELAALKPSRPMGELQALVEFARPICRVEITTTSRHTVCTKPPALVAELGRAKRRLELETILATAEGTLAHTPAVKSSDPGSFALATYLSTAGVVVTVETLAQWLTLVPVLALELGSALATVLLTSVTPGPTEPSREPQPLATILEPVETRPERLLPNLSAQRQSVANSLLVHLRTQGGTIVGNERSLAVQLGTSKPTLRRTIQALAAAGVVTPLANRTGTVLRLLPARS